MSSKDFNLANNQSITIVKRKNTKHLKLTISIDGKLKMSIPYWTPYSVGLKYANTKINWIDSKITQKKIIKNGVSVGKYHSLNFVKTTSSKLSSRVTDHIITIYYPAHLDSADNKVQAKATLAIEKALIIQAKKLLPMRLGYLSKKHSLAFNDLKIKKLSSRWGSCDHLKNITLNSRLMILPWDLIDYVILHELSHTVELSHNHKFWDKLTSMDQSAKLKRKNLRKFSMSMAY